MKQNTEDSASITQELNVAQTLAHEVAERQLEVGERLDLCENKVTQVQLYTAGEPEDAFEQD